MIVKTVDIQYCGDCPHRYYAQNELHCGLTYNLTTEGDSRTGIPEWCPLPDAKPIGQYACCVDEELGEKPLPDCVIDNGRRADCSFAEIYLTKEDCPFWRPIEWN